MANQSSFFKGACSSLGIGLDLEKKLSDLLTDIELVATASSVAAIISNNPLQLKTDRGRVVVSIGYLLYIYREFFHYFFHQPGRNLIFLSSTAAGHQEIKCQQDNKVK